MQMQRERLEANTPQLTPQLSINAQGVAHHLHMLLENPVVHHNYRSPNVEYMSTMMTEVKLSSDII